MLTVRDIAELPGLELGVAAGGGGLENPIRWVHVSELSDPTPWLEGGELLITTGLGVGELSRPQRDYVRRLAEHGLAGLEERKRGAGREQVPARVAARILALTRMSPPAETGLSHWSSRAMAAYLKRAEGITVSWHYVAKLWANGPPGEPKGTTDAIKVEMEVTSSKDPGDVDVQELTFLTVPPKLLAGAKLVSLHIQIDQAHVLNVSRVPFFILAIC